MAEYPGRWMSHRIGDKIIYCKRFGESTKRGRAGYVVLLSSGYKVLIQFEDGSGGEFVWQGDLKREVDCINCKFRLNQSLGRCPPRIITRDDKLW